MNRPPFGLDDRLNVLLVATLAAFVVGVDLDAVRAAAQAAADAGLRVSAVVDAVQPVVAFAHDLARAVA